MKKILYGTMVFAAALLSSCSDQNEVVKDLIDEVNDRPVVKNVTYTLTGADYDAIAKSSSVSEVGTFDYLTAAASADKYVPGVLTQKFLALRQGSTALVTYAYREDYLNNLSGEPATVVVSEGFDSGYAANAVVEKNGWSQFDTTGTAKWLAKTLNNNFYAEVTSFGNPKEVNNAFLVSPEFDITGLANPVMSFFAELRYPVAGQDYLRVLVTKNYNAADPKSTVWEDITDRFALPTKQTGIIEPAGVVSLKEFGGKLRVAFKYQGDDLNASLTTTLRIDSFRVADIDTSIATADGAVYIKTDGKWSVYKDGVSLTVTDLAAMGLGSLPAADAAKYLPAFLAHKFPYAQEGDKKAVVYPTSASATRADEYICKGGKWAPVVVTAQKTEQFVYGTSGWVFDPTVNYAMVGSDHQLVVTAVLSNPATSMYTRGTYTNEEWYYGFNAYYNNVSFNIANGTSSRMQVESSVKNDAELHALDGDTPAMVALLWTRLETKGMPLFLSQKYPNAVSNVQGVDVLYNIDVKVYYPDGATNTTNLYRMTYKVSKSAPNPTFEFVEKKDLGVAQ